MWLLVPLGNPGDDYVATRHNLGRLMVMRWVRESLRSHPKVSRRLRSGDVYSINHSLHILVPTTYMNLSGLACAEAVAAGYAPEHMIVTYDDKDLLLGAGRLRLAGSDGGHNGLKSVIECLQRRDIPRLRLGIGPFKRPLVDFVMAKWTKPELSTISNMDVAFARFMHLLQRTENLSKLAGATNATTFWDSTMSS